MFFHSADMSADNPVKLFEQLFQMLIDKLCKYRNVVKDTALAFKAKVSQSDLDDALAAVLEGKADKATTLDGYGITNAYTKDEINAKISAVYKPAGSVAFAELPALSESILGNVCTC